MKTKLSKEHLARMVEFFWNLHKERAKTVYPSDLEARRAVQGWVESTTYRDQLEETIKEVAWGLKNQAQEEENG